MVASTLRRASALTPAIRSEDYAARLNAEKIDVRRHISTHNSVDIQNAPDNYDVNVNRSLSAEVVVADRYYFRNDFVGNPSAF